MVEGRAADPLDGEGFGLSPFSALAQSGDVDNMITKFLQLFFQGGAIPAGLLSFEGALDDATVAGIRERWQEIYGGYENWKEVGVLDSGGKYERVGMNFEELGFASIDERNESRILGPFGVPPILIGSRLGLMRSTYANYKEAREACWEDTILPEMMLMQDDLQHYLHSDDGGYVEYNIMKAPALRKDMDKVVMAWRGLVEYGVPKNQAASLTGLELGQLPDGEVSYMPLNMAPIGQADEEEQTTEITENTENTEKNKMVLGELTKELKRANDLLEKTSEKATGEQALREQAA